jgi:hypothetical protein
MPTRRLKTGSVPDGTPPQLFGAKIMSSSPNPIANGPSPFVQTTTPAIERANRLISLRAHPGFLDLLRLSQELVDTARDICSDYGGWDAQQIVVLKVRMQCAKEHHQLLIAKLQDAIQEGIDDGTARASSLPEKSPEEMLDQGDYVRQKTLEKFNDMESRPAGSY